MKSIDNTSKNKISGALREHHLNRLVVRPLARRIKQQRRDCIKQGKRIFNKLQEVNESIEILAREIATNAKQGESRKERRHKL